MATYSSLWPSSNIMKPFAKTAGRVLCGRVSVLSGRIRAPRDRIAEHESARILILHAMLGARLARRVWDSAPLQGSPVELGEMRILRKVKNPALQG